MEANVSCSYFRAEHMYFLIDTWLTTVNARTGSDTGLKPQNQKKRKHKAKRELRMRAPLSQPLTVGVTIENILAKQPLMKEQLAGLSYPRPPLCQKREELNPVNQKSM